MLTKRQDALKPYCSTAEAIAALLYPHAEVVIHDLATDTVAAIYNNFSNRKVGSPSLLSKLPALSQKQTLIGPYPRTNWDGRPLKSISAVLQDGHGKAIGLLCINLDITCFQQLKNLTESFLDSVRQPQPAVLFQDDWQERIHRYVHDYLARQQWTLQGLTRVQKKQVIDSLWKEGAFVGKSAADYVGSILGLSRATVYNHIRKIKKTIA